MPWVGLYIGVASLICTLAMAADAILAFWQWKLWFPNKFFTLNASTITLIAIAMKLPVDLTTESDSCYHVEDAKVMAISFLSSLKRFQKIPNTPSSNGSSEIEEYSMYVVQIEEDATLTDRILRNTLSYITRVLKASEEKEPRNLMLLLEKSTSFNGVVEFENDQVQPLYEEETHNCWSLVLVTLKSIAIALPYIAPRHVKLLLSGMREGLRIKRGHNIRNAAELLGKSKKILKILKSRQLPDMDLDSRAYIDKWRVLPKSQVLNCDQGGASSTRIGPGTCMQISLLNDLAADAVHAIWQWKLWFPNRFFTLNASTITLIAIAMKLPVDLTTEPEPCFYHHSNVEEAKDMGIFFLITMLANFLPSLGLMDDRELLTNIVALGILMITITVNIGIQSFAQLEYRYKESQRLVSSYQQKRFSSKGLRSYVKKYWMMTETRNPRFVIACSAVSSAFGVICLFLSINPVLNLVFSIKPYVDHRCNTSDYKWSLGIIDIVQQFGIVVGSIAPIFRCLSSVGHYNLSKEWSKNHLNVFRVEKHWIEMLQQWKHSHSCMKMFQKITNMSSSNGSSEIKEYSMYVVQIREDAKLTDRILRNTLRYITRLFKASEEKEPRNLMLLLEKSTGFNGVVEFEIDQVQPLYEEETRNCWSLVLVTLTSIAIALPNIAPRHVKLLLSSMKEGLQIKRGHNIRNAAELLGKSKKILKILKSRQLPDMDLDSRAYIDKWRVLPISQVLNCDQGGASSTRIGPGSTSCNEPFIVSIE
ncbi:hypothetical protein L1987_86875 [Smallanthus sonchifolius]|uniref:Uncharacterized protein n=1 Tax=Smallanthus sonchifolius TaxID=185202 RepID=A0ACB8XZX9_9ASTR|nr:hypothetical protein L1987_86875 [Smallanthus sonchifolius]